MAYFLSFSGSYFNNEKIVDRYITSVIVWFACWTGAGLRRVSWPDDD